MNEHVIQLLVTAGEIGHLDTKAAHAFEEEVKRHALDLDALLAGAQAVRHEVPKDWSLRAPLSGDPRQPSTVIAPSQGIGTLKQWILNGVEFFRRGGMTLRVFTELVERQAQAVGDLEKRAQRLAEGLRETCWHAYEGSDDLICSICDATVPDGSDTVERNRAHKHNCQASPFFQPPTNARPG
jgi:hypothetical protein